MTIPQVVGPFVALLGSILFVAGLATDGPRVFAAGGAIMWLGFMLVLA